MSSNFKVYFCSSSHLFRTRNHSKTLNIIISSRDSENVIENKVTILCTAFLTCAAEWTLRHLEQELQFKNIMPK